jgi:hypothetical protein
MNVLVKGIGIGEIPNVVHLKDSVAFEIAKKVPTSKRALPAQELPVPVQKVDVTPSPGTRGKTVENDNFLAEAIKAFNATDKDNSGAIDTTELKELLSQVITHFREDV